MCVRVCMSLCVRVRVFDYRYVLHHLGILCYGIQKTSLKSLKLKREKVVSHHVEK